MALSSSDWLPNGIGPFGLALSSEKAGCIAAMRTVYGRRDLHYNAMGSGYSTLFAKHIACNCLPFAECSQQAQVETIPITRVFLHKIKSGSAIADMSIHGPVSNAATRYLDNLPSSKDNDYYRGFCPPQVLSQPGTIYNNGGQRISTWAEAVAGIAFGGLVPLAGTQLIQAVRFTVGGGEGLGGGIELLQRIIDVVGKQTAQWLPGLHLFGHQQVYLGFLYESAFLLDFSLNETDYEVRNVVRTLDRCSTLIECLTAAYQREGIDDAATRLEEVYEQTCHEIQLYFNQALGRHNKQPLGPQELSPRERSTQSNLNSFFQGSGRGGYKTNTGDRAIPPSGIGSAEQSQGSSVNNDLQEVLNLLSQNRSDRPLTAPHVAKVARCIIMMWTYIVGVVIWEKEDEEDAHGDALSPRRYKPVPFGDLPDVSAWR
ncbi:hypothetical protein CNMCM5623_000632 [Aspergillus felis]|uniref:Uncharacterized protein n=1 Tax=Aspergillus felis TaxID=1287682 RepID=A0A8H6UYD6_9EURO|nr:hypothetical protein CNMCM5623_000632 [Aspergillus felis]